MISGRLNEETGSKSASETFNSSCWSLCNVCRNDQILIIFKCFQYKKAYGPKSLELHTCISSIEMFIYTHLIFFLIYFADLQREQNKCKAAELSPHGVYLRLFIIYI